MAFDDKNKNFSGNFQNKLKEFSNSCKKKTKEELKKELKNLEKYMKIYYAGEVDDTISNTDFINSKINILKFFINENK